MNCYDHILRTCVNGLRGMYLREEKYACFKPLSTQIPIAEPIYLTIAAFVPAFAFAISRFS